MFVSGGNRQGTTVKARGMGGRTEGRKDGRTEARMEGSREAGEQGRGMRVSFLEMWSDSKGDMLL